MTIPHQRHREDRAVFWQQPGNAADMQNSLNEAYVSAKPGSLVIYYCGPVVSATRAPASFQCARDLVARFRGATLCQWPDRPSLGEMDVRKQWRYAIQKPGHFK